MQETGAGVVINIASANAFFTIPQNTAYAGAKAGIVGLTRGLALELGPQNIRVLSISPGLIATPAIREYVAALDPENGQPKWAVTTSRFLYAELASRKKLPICAYFSHRTRLHSFTAPTSVATVGCGRSTKPSPTRPDMRRRGRCL